MNRMTRIVTVLGLLSFSAYADTVTLTNGKVLDGRAVDNGDTVTIELAQGSVRIPKTQIKSIEKKETAQDEVAQRSADILAKAKDGSLDLAGQVDAWLKVARFADQHQLARSRDDAFKRVVALEPDNAEAHEGLGFVKFDGKWMTDNERYQAMGLVKFEGKWVSREALADVQKARTAERNRKAEAEQVVQRQQAELELKEAETRRLEAERQLIETQREAQYAAQHPIVQSDVVFVPVPVYAPNAGQPGVGQPGLSGNNPNPNGPGIKGPRAPAPAPNPLVPPWLKPKPAPAAPAKNGPQLPNPATSPSLPNPATSPQLPNPATSPTPGNPPGVGSRDAAE
jgi:hypothetical protein